ncbi:Effector-binding domain-containing protein OS=Bosea thiooxidans OX=53254 GN=SAMN05660750_00418 PE=4 SV=1 [Bosea thiooxidans]|uniref:Effector-binding domain-containing protein n=3 Tax=Bosea thiooxidans TaxID=53254 RepID=A0A1T5ASB7_9HYPH|nr:effector-binding domain-containing protein [Bosea thiooxidans]
MLRCKGANRVKLRAVTMRYSRICVLALAGLVSASSGMAVAQGRVAPPTAVESAPLAPPPGAAPAAPAQTPPVPVPEQPGNPQPVQPAPPAPNPVTPQPVQPAPSLPAPLEPQPVQPPPTLPVPQPGQPSAPLQQQTGLPDPNATLAGKGTDSSDVGEVTLAPKPVMVLSGQASWDQGFQKLADSFKSLRAEAQRTGLAVAGRPLTLFVETSDDGFRFEAMLPVAIPPGGQAPALGTDFRMGTSPAGPALRFLHQAPYDDIDSTYETITAYLEAKSIVVKDTFLEEYVSDLTDPGDPNLEINVYVQPK